MSDKYDLSWKERRQQEDIRSWEIKERGRGRDCKVGLGRVRVEGRWVDWEKIENGVGEEGEDKLEEHGRSR